MKVLLILASAFLSASVSAKTLTITSNEHTEKEALQPFASQLVSALHNAGAPFVDLGHGVYTVGIRGLHCDEFNNSLIDPERPEFLVPTIKCRKAAENAEGTKTGAPFQKGLALKDLLGRLQSETGDQGDLYFRDCAMGGYCGTYAKTVECWIDTKIAAESDGRFRCTLDDGN